MDSFLSDIPKKMVLDSTTEHTDMEVLVNAETERIPCHKAIVCRYSAVIDKAMKSTFKEGQTGEFKFTDQCATVNNVRQFLLAMYNPWDSDMDKYVPYIYRLAHMYEAPKVLDKAAVALGGMLTVANFWKTATVYDGHSCAELITQCRNFLKVQSKEDVDALMMDTNKDYIAAQAYPHIVMPMATDVVRRYQVWPNKHVANGECQYAGYNTHQGSKFLVVCEKCLLNGHKFKRSVEAQPF